jgi:hypothetical protein
LESGEFRADHLHRVLHDFDLVHLVEMKNRLAQVNLRDVELNLVPMVSMKDGRLMDDQNCLVDLNFRDVLPCAYSLIYIEI